MIHVPNVIYSLKNRNLGDNVSQELLKKYSLIKFETEIKKMESRVVPLQTVQDILADSRIFTDSVKD